MLRSWEKEFPGIGVQTVGDGPRVYRESDVEQVLRIKLLVFEVVYYIRNGTRHARKTPSADCRTPAGESVPHCYGAAALAGQRRLQFRYLRSPPT